MYFNVNCFFKSYCNTFNVRLRFVKPRPVGREAFLTRVGTVSCSLAGLRKDARTPQRGVLRSGADSRSSRYLFGIETPCPLESPTLFFRPARLQDERVLKRSKIFALGKFCVLETCWSGLYNLTIQVVHLVHFLKIT